MTFDADADSGQRRRNWWSSLPVEIECPITLEPIRSLPYPPFVLVDHRDDGDARGGDEKGGTRTTRSFHFDGMALASYVVSRGTFHNPLTREPLGRDDCIRLDDHLDRFHYRDGGDLGSVARCGGGGRIRVAEAHALRESLRVRTSAAATAHSDAGGQHDEPSSSARRREAEAEARRIEALRSEAAAALRGLFTYGSRGAHGGGGDAISSRRRRNRGAAYVDVASPDHHHPGSSSSAVPSVGFDLNARRRCAAGTRGDEDGEESWSIDVDAAVNRVDGLRIVDDSMVVGEAADDDEWDKVQRSFPRLVDDDVSDDNAAAASKSATDGDGGDMLRIARETAERTRLEEERLRAAILERRKVEEKAAVHRREERSRRKVELRNEATVEHERKLGREREMELARAEIDRWRERQWRRWTVTSEVGQGGGGRCDAASSSLPDSKPKGEPSLTSAEASNGRVVPVNDAGAESESVENGADDDDPTRRKKEREAAKRAAKRKKARERQRLKKKADAAERERLAAEEELRARRESAELRCASCGGGILDGGFEKYGDSARRGARVPVPVVEPTLRAVRV